MRKAMMYLLLALGICLVVAFAGGALIGFAAGFIDGFNVQINTVALPLNTP